MIYNLTPIKLQSNIATDKQIKYLLYLLSSNKQSKIDSRDYEIVMSYVDKRIAGKLIGELLKNKICVIHFVEKSEDIDYEEFYDETMCRRDHFNDLTMEEAVRDFEKYKRVV